MKQISWLVVFTLALVGMNSANADSADAILRCDPAVIIWKIDGKSDAHGGTFASGFKDCAVPLSAGKHTFEVCYDASSTSMNATIELRCDKPRDFTFDFSAGRTYRLKVAMGQPWNAWVVDVTEAEAGYSYEKPVSKPKPANKADRKTTLVLQVSPANAIPRVFSGKLLGPWFVPSMFETKGDNTGIAKAAPDGFVVVTADSGDNLTVTNVRILEGSVFMPKIYVGCDDYQSRVFDDVAGGKVLYLGHMHFEGDDGEQRVSWSDDIDAARKYVDAHFPKLAGKLESTRFTSRKLPQVCGGFPRVLTNAP